ncbi:Hypothetical protein SRAE_X000160400 [Strongyloides ratti]|uniref:Uncharacterized protein n=1 Tax=Strongyloides ratti TaxID=34506 RepID=A0A090KVG5_STRRB|nr:Hypothetical protein SRAE_X000160400 [Strongyloides ratti]CEF59860.1 Hypothetical protein SRAE_X000160400 [Strongyloides ratti]
MICLINSKKLTNEKPNGDLNYVKENGVHFKRYQSKDENLQFNRISENINILDKILSQKELIKKLDEKNVQKNNINNEKDIYINKPNIIEDDLEPNKNEIDYKEMGDH